jgi:PAH dioxygenase large subunit
MTGDGSGTARQRWVDETRGLVTREAFVGDDTYRQELERIFGRCWILLAHESEIPKPGDFVVRQLGGAPVIVVRDGEIRALLNSCRHRGTELCRADAGNARHFVCPYHGWSYRLDGSLLTTTFDRHFPEQAASFPELGLVAVPRVETYRGLVFGCWDPDAVPLEQYLGDFAWYLDMFFARSPQGMEVLAPPHRWRTRANWKQGALNFIGDSQHVLTTHVGPTTLDPIRRAQAGLFAPGEESVQLFTDEGHGATFTYLNDGVPEEFYQSHAPDLEPLYAQTLAPAQAAALRRLRVVVGNVFPNFSFIEATVGVGQKAVIIRLWQPVGATEMEILSWVLAEREASAGYKQHALNTGFRLFGVAGVFEQDDLTIWASAMAASDNPVARRHPYSFQTALPYMDRPEADFPGPGRIWRPVDTEVVQFEFMRHWQRVMLANA